MQPRPNLAKRLRDRAARVLAPQRAVVPPSRRNPLVNKIASIVLGVIMFAIYTLVLGPRTSPAQLHASVPTLPPHTRQSTAVFVDELSVVNATTEHQSTAAIPRRTLEEAQKAETQYVRSAHARRRRNRADFMTALANAPIHRLLVAAVAIPSPLRDIIPALNLFLAVPEWPSAFNPELTLLAVTGEPSVAATVVSAGFDAVTFSTPVSPSVLAIVERLSPSVGSVHVEFDDEVGEMSKCDELFDSTVLTGASILARRRKLTQIDTDLTAADRHHIDLAPFFPEIQERLGEIRRSRASPNTNTTRSPPAWAPSHNHDVGVLCPLPIRPHWRDIGDLPLDKQMQKALQGLAGSKSKKSGRQSQRQRQIELSAYLPRSLKEEYEQFLVQELFWLAQHTRKRLIVCKNTLPHDDVAEPLRTFYGRFVDADVERQLPLDDSDITNADRSRLLLRAIDRVVAVMAQQNRTWTMAADTPQLMVFEPSPPPVCAGDNDSPDDAQRSRLAQQEWEYTMVVAPASPLHHAVADMRRHYFDKVDERKGGHQFADTSHRPRLFFPIDDRLLLLRGRFDDTSILSPDEARRGGRLVDFMVTNSVADFVAKVRGAFELQLTSDIHRVPLKSEKLNFITANDERKRKIAQLVEEVQHVDPHIDAAADERLRRIHFELHDLRQAPSEAQIVEDHAAVEREVRLNFVRAGTENCEAALRELLSECAVCRIHGDKGGPIPARKFLDDASARHAFVRHFHTINREFELDENRIAGGLHGEHLCVAATLTDAHPDEAVVSYFMLVASSLAPLGFTRQVPPSSLPKEKRHALEMVSRRKFVGLPSLGFLGSEQDGKLRSFFDERCLSDVLTPLISTAPLLPTIVELFSAAPLAVLRSCIPSVAVAMIHAAAAQSSAKQWINTCNCPELQSVFLEQFPISNKNHFASHPANVFRHEAARPDSEDAPQWTWREAEERLFARIAEAAAGVGDSGGGGRGHQMAENVGGRVAVNPRATPTTMKGVAVVDVFHFLAEFGGTDVVGSLETVAVVGSAGLAATEVMHNWWNASSCDRDPQRPKIDLHNRINDELWTAFAAKFTHKRLLAAGYALSTHNAVGAGLSIYRREE